MTKNATIKAALLGAAVLLAAGYGTWRLYSSGDTPAPVVAEPADAQTTRIVAAADAFLATLDETQRSTVSFGWGDSTQRANWSNFPIDIVARAGLAWGDMTADQHTALTTLLATVLSPDGMTMVQNQMAADQWLADNPDGDMNLSFGEAFYYVSFLGEPSETTAWTLQFGGHHLAINATVAGPHVTLAPSLTGGQPLRFDKDGTEIWIVADEVTAAQALIDSLDDAQKAVAVQADTGINLVLGPGEDGNTVDPVGLTGADMTPAQLALLRGLIETRLGLLNADDLAAAMALVDADLAQTSIGWWGPVGDATVSYWRVTGPRIMLEFSGQDMGGSVADHAHNMLRDPLNDYGAIWLAGQ